MKFWACLLTVVIVFPVWGKIELSTPISLSGDGLNKWQTETKTKELYYNSRNETLPVQCRLIKEIPGTLICLSKDQSDIGKYFGRASLYTEGAGKDLVGEIVGKGQLIERGSIVEQVYSQSLGGIDLRGEAMINFFEKADFACTCAPTNSRVCLSYEEREIYESVVLPLSKFGPLVIISAPYDSDKAVAHEILHAQYFNEPTFRQAINSFWREEMTPQDRYLATNILSSFYDGKDEDLIRNEFQAYVLEPFDQPEFESLQVRFRKRLKDYLNAHNIYPIQVNTVL